MQKIVLATSNPGKVEELTTLLAPTIGFQVVPQTQLGISPIAETGLTFVENALLKARHAAHLTGLPTLSDDSGLAVDALRGAPGLHSARYAGEEASQADNIDKLLEQLQAVPADQRHAQFYCVMIYLRHANDPIPLICQGSWHGTIATTLSGSKGFGYDALFYLPDLGCTAAELSSAKKNRLSHRSQAVQQLLKLLVYA